MRHRPLLAIVLLSILLTACATNPATKSSEFVLMSEKQELAIGQQMAMQVAKQLPLLPEKDPLARYVDQVGQRVAATADRPELFYRFHVIDNGTINAFALPGGHIYIHRGLIAHLNSEAELAAVLGHEVGHVTARHAVQRYSRAQAANIGITVATVLAGAPQAAGDLGNLLATAMIMGYGREQELESDELSLKYLARAGYDAKATIHLLETLERLDALVKQEKEDAGEKVQAYHGAFSSHPETKKRIEESIAKAASMQAGAMNRVGREALLAAIDGYPFKDGTRDGAVVGRRFLHPDLGIQLEFPDEWVINNTPAALTARIRKKDAYFLLAMRHLRKRASAEEVLKSLYPARRMGPVTSGTHNGYSYARSRVMASAPSVSTAAIDANLFLERDKAFIVLLYSKRNEIDRYQPQFDRIRNSFRSYDVKRDGDIPRVRVYTWKKGDSWEALARRNRQILGRFTAQRLAILNGMEPESTPAPGTIIKNVK